MTLEGPARELYFPSAAGQFGRAKGSRFINRVTGENIPRRQYENLRAREAGFPSYSYLQRIRKRGPSGPGRGPKPLDMEAIGKSGLYAVWQRVWEDTAKKPSELLRTPTTPEAREFNNLLREAIESGEWEPGGETENNGEAPNMEAILEFIGLRNQNALERMTVGTYDYAIEIGISRRLRRPANVRR